MEGKSEACKEILTLGELREQVEGAIDEWTYEVVIRRKQGEKYTHNIASGVFRP